MFWDNFTQICEERETSPSRLLRKMGYSTSKIDLWKNGSLPKEKMLNELADELHCSVADFFDDTVHLLFKDVNEWAEARQLAEEEKARLNLTPDEIELLEVYHNSDRKKQLKIMYYVISLEDIDDDE